MLYRVSQSTIYRNINTNLSTLSYRMAEINNQIAAGRKVIKPSDDPSGGALILSMRSVLSGVSQYGKDLSIADDWLKQTESVLQGMKDILERANILAEQMSTDTYTEENMDVAAEEIEQLMDGLIKNGNTRIGDRYIFAGQLTEVNPFVDGLTIWDPVADRGNSIGWTGLVKQSLFNAYAARPDLPAVTDTYIAEIVNSGGTTSHEQARLTLDDLAVNHDGLSFTAKESAAYGLTGNQISIEYIDPGAATATTTAAVVGAGPPWNIQVTLSHDGTNVTATANDVIAAIHNNAAAYDLVDVELANDSLGTGIVQATGPTNLANGADGGLTRATTIANPQGANNAIQLDASGTRLGSAGNAIQIEFQRRDQANDTFQIIDSEPVIQIRLATDSKGEVITTADDIIAAINSHATLPNWVTASLPPSGSGSGVFNIPVETPAEPVTTYSLSGGYDQTAQYRVSTDGGKTWSEQLFDVSESLDPDVFYNDKPGHASLSTNFIGAANDLFIVAKEFGNQGENIAIEFVAGAGPNTTADILDPVNDPNTITITLAPGATADDVLQAINDPLVPNANTSTIQRMIHAELSDYREGGNGPVEVMSKTFLSGSDSRVTMLGHSTLDTSQAWEPPDSNPNVVFTSVAHGDIGDNINVEYVMKPSTDPTYGQTSVSVDAATNTVTVHLAQDGNDQVVATAQDVVREVNNYYYDPDYPDPNGSWNPLVIANLPQYSDGGGIVQEMDATSLSGGDDLLNIDEYGAKIRFEGDGSPLVAGDKFYVDVGYYRGDDQDIEVNSNVGDRVKINVTGEEALGEVGATDNILDVLAHLKYALEQHDSVEVASTLPALNDALDNLTSQMSRAGVRLVRNEFTYNILESIEISSTERLSRVEDLDLADAITSLQIKQTAYQALLATTSMVTQISLVDYIR